MVQRKEEVAYAVSSFRKMVEALRHSHIDVVYQSQN
jgi:hypothetical protein